MSITAPGHPDAPDGGLLRRHGGLLGAGLVGAAVGATGFAALALLRAAPPSQRPTSVLVWAGIGTAALAIGAAMWLLLPRRESRGRLAAAVGAGLVLALALTAATNLSSWRTIAGHPDNAPGRFYAPDAVAELTGRLIDEAAGRDILGIYLSNHYESQIVVPLSDGPQDHRGGEIIAIAPDGSLSRVQTVLSEGVAAADGLDPATIDPQVISSVAEQAAEHYELAESDEVRVQLQSRGGVTQFSVLVRRAEVDQPWLFFDLNGALLGQ